MTWRDVFVWLAKWLVGLLVAAWVIAKIIWKVFNPYL